MVGAVSQSGLQHLEKRGSGSSEGEGEAPMGGHGGIVPARWWACTHTCFPQFSSQTWLCTFPSLLPGIPRPGRAFPLASSGFVALPPWAPGASVPVPAHRAPKL